MLASLAILLVLLPTLESAVRKEQIPRERASLLQQVERLGASNGLSSDPTPQELREMAVDARTILGGEVSIVFFGTLFANSARAQAPGAPMLLRRFPEPTANLSQTAQRDDAVWAAAPLFVGGAARGTIAAAHPVRGVPAELAIVRRRVFIAMVLVLSLASLSGSRSRG